MASGDTRIEQVTLRPRRRVVVGFAAVWLAAAAVTEDLPLTAERVDFQAFRPDEPFDAVLDDLDRRLLDGGLQAVDARDQRRANIGLRRAGRRADQGRTRLEDDLDRLATFHRLGVRVMQVTYMEANYAGQGCLERIDAGLTGFGIEAVEEMNRLGILIDLSHVGYRTTMEAIEASKKPVAFTHANPKSICNHPRNKPDEALKAVAKKGGIIGATIFPAFLPSGNKSTLKDFVDVIDHLVGMVGIDHVGVGTDFTEGQPRGWFDWILTGKSKKGPALALNHPLVNPEGIQHSGDFSNITAALLARGYADTDVQKIIGLNFMRLFEEIW